VTPRFQSDPALFVIACVVPPSLTRTQFAGVPSRFRYDTVTTMVVVGKPESGETAASESLVGPAAAHAGTTADRTSTNAAIDATIRACRPPPTRDHDRVPG
jgi:hypothetical protein